MTHLILTAILTLHLFCTPPDCMPELRRDTVYMPLVSAGVGL